MRFSHRVLEGQGGGLRREQRLNRRYISDGAYERQAEDAKGIEVGKRGKDGAEGLDSARKAQRAGKRSSVSMRQSANKDGRSKSTWWEGWVASKPSRSTEAQGREVVA